MLPNQVIDHDELFSRMSGDIELLREVIELFREEYPPLVEDIRDSLMQRDAMMLQNAAHSLKGAVAVFSAKDVYNAALKLELMGRNKDFNRGVEAFANLKSELDKLQHELNALEIRKAS